jgi:hypothetical protein
MLTAAQHRKRYKDLYSESSTWRAHWQEIGRNSRPRGVRFNVTDGNRGGEKNDSIINGTPVFALRTLASGMMAGITSPSRPWFRLLTPDASLNERPAVKQWLAIVEERVRLAMAKSNVYNILHALYSELGGFGTAVALLEEDEEDIMRGYHLPIGSYVLANSARLDVEVLYRLFRMTVGQMAERFGIERCSSSVQAMHRAGNFDSWVQVLHCISRNESVRVGQAMGVEGKAYLSTWIEYDSTEKDDGLLEVLGYHEKPFFAPRWETTGEDVYGGSPGMDALGDSRALQVLELRKAQAAEKLVNPAMVGDSRLMNSRITLLPGDTTFIDGTTGADGFKPAHEVAPAAVQVAGAEIIRHEERINRAYYADLWLMLSQSDGTMTAREVVERREEKLLQLATVLEKLADELLDPVIARSFGILFRSGQVPEAPPELVGEVMRVEYLGVMAQAQKMLGTAGIERVVGIVTSLAAVNNSVVDKLDVDQTVDEYADMMGVKPGIIRPDAEVDVLRAQRQQQQQAAQAMAAAQQASVTAKNLATSPTSPEGGNALQDILTNMGVR